MFKISHCDKFENPLSTNGAYPSDLHVFKGGEQSYHCEQGHYFGYVLQGEVSISATEHGEFKLREGMYFSVFSDFVLQGSGRVVIFLRYGYRGLFMIGGPSETQGRLCYIDNCSSTLLCPPPRNGDPCLNLLTFPAHIIQTQHIHPSARLGAVVAGSGYCVLGTGERQPLSPGQVFLIGEQTVHSFESGGDGLRVIAYHPDSEAGPTDSHHPMLARTYIKK